MTAADREAPLRNSGAPDTSIPEVQLLSNGSYHVMLTGAGGGYSRWNNLALTRWHDDATCDSLFVRLDACLFIGAILVPAFLLTQDIAAFRPFRPGLVAQSSCSPSSTVDCK